MPDQTRKGPLAALLVLVCALGAHCSPGAQPGDSEGSGEAVVPPPSGRDDDRDDRVVAAAVSLLLTVDPYVDATRFDVEVSDGAVRLRSRSESAAEWERARDVAALAEGVEQVLMVDAAPAPGSGEETPFGDTPELRELAEAFPEAARMGIPPATRLEPPELDGSGEAPIAQAASGDRPRTYVVQPGDSLSVIAQETLGDGMAWPRIYELNRSMIGPDAQALHAGMELRIPQD